MNGISSNPSLSPEARGRRFLPRIMVGLATLLLVTACTTGGASRATAERPGPSSTTATSVPSEAATPSPSPTFPLSVVDDDGTSVAIPAEPHHIVTLTAAATETAFALGLGPRVVATDSASDYPPEAVPLPDVAAFGSVDVEKIVGAGADLVIAGGNGDTPPDGIDRLRQLHVPVVVVYARTIDAAYGDVALIGRAAGVADAGAALVASMQGQIEALTKAVSGEPRPKVFYEVDATNEIYGPADESFLTQMLTLADADPVTSGSADSYQIPLERLVAANPDVIVLGDAAYGVTLDVVKARAGWRTIAAVINGDIRSADDKLITRPGPRLAEGLRSLILAIHPDAKLP